MLKKFKTSKNDFEKKQNFIIIYNEGKLCLWKRV